MKPEVSIIIPTYNRVSYTRRCLRALAANTPDHLYELIIVDNCSTDATRPFLRELEGDVKIILNDENQGFARACNAGAKLAEGEFLVFLNNDTEPLPGWLENLLTATRREPRVGAVGCKLLFPDDTVQHAGVVIGVDPATGGLAPYHLYYRFDSLHPLVNKPRRLQAVTGACLLTPRRVFWEAGGFDERFYNGYEDIDFCFRLRERGYQVLYTPWAQLVHHESVSGHERFRKYRENLALLFQRWSGKVLPDDTRVYLEDGLVVRYEQSDGALRKALDPIGNIVMVLPAGALPDLEPPPHRPWGAVIIFLVEGGSSDPGQSAPEASGGSAQLASVSVLHVPPLHLNAALARLAPSCHGVLFCKEPDRVKAHLVNELLCHLTLAPTIGLAGTRGMALLNPLLAPHVADSFFSADWEQRMAQAVRSHGYNTVVVDAP